MNSEPSIGEVYRICQRIEAQTKETNGRVTKLEHDSIRIKTIWTLGVVVLGFFGDWVKHKIGL